MPWDTAFEALFLLTIIAASALVVGAWGYFLVQQALAREYPAAGGNGRSVGSRGVDEGCQWVAFQTGLS